MSQTTLREAAEKYVPKQSLTIADLKEVLVNTPIHVAIAKEGTADEYTYSYIEFNEEEYRVPDKVLKDLQEILKKKPTLTKFSVSKSGTGLKTQYTVIPLD